MSPGHLVRYLSLILLVFVLTACGGGGGGGSSVPSSAVASSVTDDRVSLDEDSSVLIDVTANDSQVDAASLSIVSDPESGTAAVTGGQIEYVPEADFAGEDSFQYRVEAADGSALTASVFVTVNNINDAPVAVADSFSLVEDHVLDLTLAANDTDIDSEITEVILVDSPDGSIEGAGLVLTYTPPLDFVGEDRFSYRAIDAEGQESNEVSVTIDVLAVTVTVLETLTLPIPDSGYASGNDAELNAAVLMSEALTFDVPPNPVSVLLTLNGVDANLDDGGLFISALEKPSGPLPVYQREVHFCFGGHCSGLVPRRPGYVAEAGLWRYRLGTLAPDLADIDFTGLSLTVTIRSGPSPDAAQSMPATLRVQPYLTAGSLTAAELGPVLDRVASLAQVSDLRFTMQPVEILDDPSYDVVSIDFLDETTSALVSLGDADTVNIFFVEGFSGNGSQGGVSGGIPGGLGFQNGHNGVLLNTSGFTVAGVLAEEDLAETTFHEIGHLLGLYHTTEARFTHTDVLADTPECIEELHDINNNGTANTLECPDVSNPMFWRRSDLFDWLPLSDDQQWVIRHTPLAVPGA